MTRGFLQVVGVATIVAVIGAGIAAALFVRERFVVTVEPESARAKAGPDPATLLRDDVHALRRDVVALAKSLERNFETLAARGDDAPDALGKTVEAAIAPLRASVDALLQRAATLDATVTARLEALRTEHLAAIADLRARIDALAAQRAAVVAAAPPPTAVPPAPIPPAPAPTATLPPPTKVPAPASSEEAGAPPPSATAATPPPAPPPPAGKRRPFLSFSLPSQSLDLDKATKFEIVPALSRVGFDGKSTLHDFSGTTSEVSGSFVARLSKPDAKTTGTISATSASIDTGIVERNADMLALLEVKRFPTIVLAIASFQPTEGDPKTGAWKGTVRGTFTIHGVAKEVSFPVSVSLDESRRVVVAGEGPLALRDFGIVPPTKAGIISMENEVKVWFTIRARAAGAAE